MVARRDYWNDRLKILMNMRKFTALILCFFYTGLLFGQAKEPYLVYQKPCTNFKRTAYKLSKDYFEIEEEIEGVVTAKWYGRHYDLSLEKLSQNKPVKRYYSYESLIFGYFDSLKLWDLKGNKQMELYNIVQDRANNLKLVIRGYLKNKLNYELVSTNGRSLINSYEKWDSEIKRLRQKNFLTSSVYRYFDSLTFYHQQSPYVSYSKVQNNANDKRRLDYIQTFWKKNGKQRVSYSLSNGEQDVVWRKDSLLQFKGYKITEAISAVEDEYTTYYPSGKVQFTWIAKGENIQIYEFYENGKLKKEKKLRMVQAMSKRAFEDFRIRQVANQEFYCPFAWAPHILENETHFAKDGGKVFEFKQTITDDFCKVLFKSKDGSGLMEQVELPAYRIDFDQLSIPKLEDVKRDSFLATTTINGKLEKRKLSKSQAFQVLNKYARSLKVPALLGYNTEIQERFNLFFDKTNVPRLQGTPLEFNYDYTENRVKRTLHSSKKYKYLSTVRTDLFNVFSELIKKDVAVKKDFEACLFGIWDKNKNQYITKPEYSFIESNTKRNYYSKQVYFKASKDNIEYVILNAKGKVVYKQEGDFYFRWNVPSGNKPAYYTFRKHRDSAYVLFTPAFRKIGSYQALPRVEMLDNGALQLHFYRQKTQIFYINQSQNAVRLDVAEPLNHLSKGLYYLSNQIVEFDSLGLNTIFKASSRIKKYHSSLVYFDLDSLYVMTKRWNDFDIESISMDDPKSFLNTAWLYLGYNKRNLNYFVYSDNGKFGALNLRLVPLLKPEWDKVGEDFFAFKDTERYMFNHSGGVLSFPYKLVYSDNSYRAQYKVYKDSENELKLLYKNTWFPMPIEEVLNFRDANKKSKRLQLIFTKSGEVYTQSYFGFYRVDLSLSGLVKSALNQKDYVLINNEITSRAYDTIYSQTTTSSINAFVNSYFPNLRAYSNDSLYLLMKNGRQEVYQKNKSGSKEFLVQEEVYGYTNDYQFYYNDCQGTQKLPDGVWDFKVYGKMPSSIMALHFADEKMVANTRAMQSQRFYSKYKDPNEYNNWQELYNEKSYVLYNKELKKKSSFMFNGKLKTFDNHLQAELKYGTYRLVNNQLEDVLPIKSYNKITKAYGFYMIVSNGIYYRFQPSSNKLDTLNEKVKFWDSTNYAVVRNKTLIVYDYDQNVVLKTEAYGLNEMGEWRHLLGKSCLSCNFVWNGSASSNSTHFNKLTDLQKQFLLSLSFANNFCNISKKQGANYMRSKTFPEYTYFHERMDKYYAKQKSVKSSKSYIEDDVDYEMEIEEVAIEYSRHSSRSGSGYYANYDDPGSFNNAKNDMQGAINNMSLRSSNVNFLTSGLVVLQDLSYRKYGPDLILELKDSGYALLNMADLVDPGKKDSLEKYLNHQISINPNYWGVTCQADLDKYNFVRFQQMFHINSGTVNFSLPGKSAIRVNKVTFGYFVKPEYQKYFKL